jgi:hypothetical protein
LGILGLGELVYLGLGVDLAVVAAVALLIYYAAMEPLSSGGASSFWATNSKVRQPRFFENRRSLRRDGNHNV